MLMAITWSSGYLFPPSEEPTPYLQQTEIEENGHTILHEYSFWEGEEGQPTVLLFPDHAFGADFLTPLSKSLHDIGYRVLLMHYPVRDIEQNVISHSTSMRAQYTATLLDSLDIDRVHALGHGYGGLVLGNFASKFTGKVQSSLFLSSYGVEELHFLGNETINRSLYSLLYPAAFIFRNLTPHMGWYHRQWFNYDFARAQRSMEQRNFRDQLFVIDSPVLILEPSVEHYLSTAVAQETHRLLPQSYYSVIKGAHSTIKSEPELTVQQMAWFIDMAEQNELLTRAEASEKRKNAAIQPFNPDEAEAQNFWAIAVIIILLALISLVSEDLACIAGGLLVVTGVINFWIAIFGGALGIVTADIFTYLLGRWIGKPVLEKVPFKWIIKPADLKRAENMFEIHGVSIIFASRFIPGTRFPTYLAAGILRVKLLFFTGYFLLAVAIWVPLLVGITILIGQPMISYLETYQEYAWIVIAVVFVLIYAFIKFAVPLMTIRGRRRFIVRLNRIKERWWGDE